MLRFYDNAAVNRWSYDTGETKTPMRKLTLFILIAAVAGSGLAKDIRYTRISPTIVKERLSQATSGNSKRREHLM